MTCKAKPHLPELKDNPLDDKFSNVWQFAIDDAKKSSIHGSESWTRQLGSDQGATEEPSSPHQILSKKFLQQKDGGETNGSISKEDDAKE